MYINQSLSYLEQCVVALSRRNAGHVPYRQSKLTNILKVGNELRKPRASGRDAFGIFEQTPRRRAISAIADLKLCEQKGLRENRSNQEKAPAYFLGSIGA